jgi:uncharacterized protein (DUF58 family)
MSVRPSENSRRSDGMWLWLTAIVVGASLVVVFFTQPALAGRQGPLVTLVYLGIGAGACVWGLYGLWKRARWKGRRAMRATERQHHIYMRRQAWAFVVILVVLCLGALVGQSNMLLLVFGLMLGPFVLSGQVTLATLSGLTVSRKLPQHAIAGENFTVRLKLSNRKRLFPSWMIAVRDRISNAAEVFYPAALFTHVNARGEREASYQVRPARRGVYDFGSLQVASQFPLGLVERSFETGADAELIVYPRLGRLTSRWNETEPSRAQLSERTTNRPGPYDDDFHRLREYRPGDSTRRIHWRTTARRNELTVREFQINRAQRLLLLVDLWLPSRATSADIERVELAISFAATICVEPSRQASEAAIRLILCGENVECLDGGGSVHATELLLERLAVAKAAHTPQLPEAGWDAFAATPDVARRVLLTTRLPGDPALEKAHQTGLATNGQQAMAPAEVIHTTAALVAEFFELDQVAGQAP